MNFCKKYIGLLLILGMLVGYFVPQLALLKSWLPYLLTLMLYNSLLTIRIRPEHFFQKKLLLFPLLNWLILPLIIIHTFHFFSYEYQLGLLITIITPTALGSPVITRLTGGKIETSMSFLLIFNLIAPFSYPFLLWLYFSGMSVSIPIWAILLRTATIIFIPLIFSIITKQLPKIHKFMLEKVSPINTFLVVFLVMIVISSARLQIEADSKINLLQLFSYILLISGFLYAFGYFIAGKDQLLQRTLPISLGHKNTGLAILVCVANFSAVVAIPAVLYIIAHHLLNALFIQIFQIKKSRSDSV
ncbi:MAG: bile acid:sodium symporter [Candidatus Cloacimonadales bacterium]